MKQIISTLLLLVSLVSAGEIDECKTDLYFGNGVWNSYSMADNGRKELQNRNYQRRPAIRREIQQGQTGLQLDGDIS